MKTCRLAIFAVVIIGMSTEAVRSDLFGSGQNQFEIEFTTISGNSNPTGPIGEVARDYRIGVFEITNKQWNSFEAATMTAVAGTPPEAYDNDFSTPGGLLPKSYVSWFEAAQFVNWLNTSSGHHAAYNFTGTQGTSDYTFSTWPRAEADGATNLYRHRDAYYFLPSEDEWTKAAYWNGTTIQTFATRSGETLYQGDGISGTGWNYFDPATGYAPGAGDYLAWDVGTGSEELNGTFDMMGNVREWIESPAVAGDYQPNANRLIRGGSYFDDPSRLVSSYAQPYTPVHETGQFGFRIASVVPEPWSIALISVLTLVLVRPNRRRGTVNH